MQAPTINTHASTYGLEARDRRADMLQPGPRGARAALESFYFAFNNQSLEVFDAVWADDPLIQLNNPLGGIDRGLGAIRELYRKIFEGPSRVSVELHDIVESMGTDMAVFAGRERASSERDGQTLDFEIRTTRLFGDFGPEVGWKQIHHHGSIANAEVLRWYQLDVLGKSASRVHNYKGSVECS